MKVLLPNSVALAPEPNADVTYVTYDVKNDVTNPLPAQHHDAEVLVAWGNPRAQLQQLAQNLPRLRWVQGLAAGPNSLLNAGFAKDVIITSGRGLHDTTVAEHALALMLAAARKLHMMRDAQHDKRYPKELGGVQPVDPAGKLTSLQGARVLVWGFGSIAKALAPLLVALGAEVTGIARSSGTRAGFTVFAESELEQHLPNSDVLVMILPSTPANHYALNTKRLACLPEHAWLVNVGRGDTVNEADLVAALNNGTIAGAALDVFETEPLPETSPLWELENVIISPHAAGGRPRGASELIASNVRKFLAGEMLTNTIDRAKGY